MSIIAISGMNGFLGSKLREFYETDNEVYGIDRFFLRKRHLLRTFFENTKPDLIIHCAAYGNMSFQNDEDEIFTANVIGTWNLLQATKDIDYKKLIIIGSSSEYGLHLTKSILDSDLMKETDCPEGESCYSATKISATNLALSFAKNHNKSITVVRPFSIYGEGEADFRLMPTICRSIIEQETIELEPNMVHDWIHIDDVVSAISLIAESDEEIVNVGTGVETPNIDILTKLMIISGIKPEVKLINPLNIDPHLHWKANNLRLKDLGWEQAVDLDQGLKRVWEYEKKKYD